MQYRSEAYSCPLDEARQHWLDYLDDHDSIAIELCAQFTVDAINDALLKRVESAPTDAQQPQPKICPCFIDGAGCVIQETTMLCYGKPCVLERGKLSGVR